MNKNDSYNSQKKENSIDEDSAMKFEKRLYCRYDPAISFENALGGLRIFLPTVVGYINYNFVHSFDTNSNCDMWRLGQAYAFDNNLGNEFALTPPGAEWDMALKLRERPDFIGGHAHGDEKYTSLSVVVDEKNADIQSLEALTSFGEMIIAVESVGYDPDDSVTQALKHFKEYIINENGITLNQRVEWLNDYTLDSSYLAMMPPLKALTDSFYTDVEGAPKEAISNYGYVSGAQKAVVYSLASGITFSMSVTGYPSLYGGDRFLLTDNGGGFYNKMYFVVCDGASVSKGDIWESTTKYVITHENV